MSRFKMVLLSDLEPPELDMRSVQSEQGFEELRNSVKEIGVQEPIKVNERADGKLEVVFGTRRVKASLAVGLARIPAVIAKMTPEEVLKARCAENLHREDVSAIDMARWIERIIATLGYTQIQVSKLLGLSDGRVSQLLTILRKDPVIRDMVEEGKIPEAVGRELLRHPNERIRHDLAGFAARDGWNQQATRRYVEQDVAISQGGTYTPPSEPTDEFVTPQRQVIPTYACRLCGHVVPIESMVIFRACSDCGSVLEDAIEGGAFLERQSIPAETTDGPGDRGAGPDVETPDAD